MEEKMDLQSKIEERKKEALAKDIHGTVKRMLLTAQSESKPYRSAMDHNVHYMGDYILSIRKKKVFAYDAGGIRPGVTFYDLESQTEFFFQGSPYIENTIVKQAGKEVFREEKMFIDHSEIKLEGWFPKITRTMETLSSIECYIPGSWEEKLSWLSSPENMSSLLRQYAQEKIDTDNDNIARKYGIERS